jgi:hypothetical protein
MTRSDLLKAAQSRAARIAVSASAGRGHGNTGVVAAARDFLRSMDLRPFGTTGARAFALSLNRSTQALLRSLPHGARHWGVARKLINIFLRDCLYTTYLEDAYHLGRAEKFYEVPLDSITAKHIRRRVARGVLPPWRGVRHNHSRQNASYQDSAKRIAAEERISRVHLDAFWWSVSRDSDAA